MIYFFIHQVSSSPVFIVNRNSIRYFLSTLFYCFCLHLLAYISGFWKYEDEVTVTTELSSHLITLTTLFPAFPTVYSLWPRSFFLNSFLGFIGQDLSILFSLIVPVHNIPKFSYSLTRAKQVINI